MPMYLLENFCSFGSWNVYHDSTLHLYFQLKQMHLIFFCTSIMTYIFREHLLRQTNMLMYVYKKEYNLNLNK